METTSGWVDDAYNFLPVVSGDCRIDDRRKNCLSLASMELKFARIKHTRIELNILFSILDCLLNDVNSDNFLGILAKAESYGPCAAAYIKKHRSLVDSCKVCDQL